MQKHFKNVKLLKNLELSDWQAGDIITDNGVIAYAGKEKTSDFQDVIDLRDSIIIPSFKNYYLNLLNLSSSEIEERIFANIKSGITDFIVVTDNYLLCKYLFESYNLKGKIALPPDFDFESVTGENVLIFVDPITMEENMLDDASDIAAKKGYKVLIKLFDNLDETGELNTATKQLPINYVENFGLLDRGGYISGAICSDKEDYRLLNDYNFEIITRPIADLRKGNGFANLVQIENAGLQIHVGSDDEKYVDIFSYARALLLGTKGMLCDSECIDESKVLRILTKSNTVEENADADFIALDGKFNSVEEIVNTANACNIKMVVSGGKIIYVRGEENAN